MSAIDKDSPAPGAASGEAPRSPRTPRVAAVMFEIESIEEITDEEFARLKEEWAKRRARFRVYAKPGEAPAKG